MSPPTSRSAATSRTTRGTRASTPGSTPRVPPRATTPPHGQRGPDPKFPRPRPLFEDPAGAAHERGAAAKTERHVRAEGRREHDVIFAAERGEDRGRVGARTA